MPSLRSVLSTESIDTWYTRVVGSLANLGHQVSRTTVANSWETEG